MDPVDGENLELRPSCCSPIQNNQIFENNSIFINLTAENLPFQSTVPATKENQPERVRVQKVL